MRIIDALLGEHGAFYAIFNDLERDVPGMQEAAAIRAAGATLGAALATHATIENEVLFPEIERRVGPGGPLAVMRYEHDQIEGGLARLAGCGEAAAARVVLLGTLATAREHFAKEENILFPLAAQILEKEMERLGDMWAERRGVMVRSQGAPACSHGGPR
jgi:iron-sulfur cluster repair protein YtfE (RIC family)